MKKSAEKESEKYGTLGCIFLDGVSFARSQSTQEITALEALVEKCEAELEKTIEEFGKMQWRVPFNPAFETGMITLSIRKTLALIEQHKARKK